MKIEISLRKFANLEWVEMPIVAFPTWSGTKDQGIIRRDSSGRLWQWQSSTINAVYAKQASEIAQTL